MTSLIFIVLATAINAGAVIEEASCDFDGDENEGLCGYWVYSREKDRSQASWATVDSSISRTSDKIDGPLSGPTNSGNY